MQGLHAHRCARAPRGTPRTRSWRRRSRIPARLGQPSALPDAAMDGCAHACVPCMWLERAAMSFLPGQRLWLGTESFDSGAERCIPSPHRPSTSYTFQAVPSNLGQLQRTVARVQVSDDEASQMLQRVNPSRFVLAQRACSARMTHPQPGAYSCVLPVLPVS
jgi:hypothetical protein